MSKAVYTSNKLKIKGMVEARAKICNRLLCEEIHRQANKTTPLRDTSMLRGSCKKTYEGLSGIMVWDVPYAAYQERGMRYDKSHVVRNYTTAGTGPWFAKNAVESTVNTANIKKFWRSY